MKIFIEDKEHVLLGFVDTENLDDSYQSNEIKISIVNDESMNESYPCKVLDYYESIVDERKFN